MKLKLKPQKHRAIVSRGILDTIEYEIAHENKADDILDIVSRGILDTIEYEIANENKADDILDIVIDIRDTAERIIKLMQKGE